MLCSLPIPSLTALFRLPDTASPLLTAMRSRGYAAQVNSFAGTKLMRAVLDLERMADTETGT